MYIDLDQYVKRTSAIVTGGVVAIVAAAVAFVVGSITVQRDAAQMQAEDARQTLIAEAGCPRRAQLWQHPRTGRMACVLTNPDGEMMMIAVQEPRLVVVQR